MQQHLAATLLNTIPKELLATAQLQKFPAGSFIKRSGSSFCHFCILAKGTAKLVYDDGENPPLIIDLYHTGDFFGEMEAVGMQTDDRSIVALTDCELYRFTKEQFIAMWNQYNDVSRYILYVHCERLIRAGDDKIRSENVFLRDKVFRIIQENLNSANYFLYTKDVLAEMSGTSIRSLNRALAELKEAKLISFSSGIRLNV